MSNPPPIPSTDAASPAAPPPRSRWGSWFGGGGLPRAAVAAAAAPPSAEGGGGGCPVRGSGGDVAGGGCPVGGVSGGRVRHPFPLATPASVEEAAAHPQSPRPDQTVPLSTVRAVSSIPRGDVGVGGGGAGSETPAGSPAGCAPSHQPPEAHRWVYPSEQQLYNAMRRKGWDIADESTVPLVLRIHNAVNERGWAEVRRWESELHGCDSPRLVRFLGRPSDTSPKAWFNSHVLMYRAPFDRHDWYVDRGDGSGPRRYVIDFYEGNGGAISDPGGPPRPPGMYLDVRPALDDPSAFVDRARMFVRDAFPGLFAAFGTTGAGSARPNNGGDVTGTRSK